MDKKKILIVSSSFYPANSPRAFRTTELVKEFCRQGHEVTLITHKKEEHRLIETEYGVKIKDFGGAAWPEINFSQGNKIWRTIKRGLRKLLLVALEYPDIALMFLARKALRQESGYDLLISIAVPHPIHWGVALARKHNHPVARIWTADCGDPYMHVIDASHSKPFYFKYIEKWFCNKADYISVPKIEMRENYYPEFRNKIVEIPQGFRFEDFQSEQTPQNDIPHFAFAGTFMRIRRNPTKLLDYLTASEKDFRFIIYSRDPGLALPYKSRLKERLEIRPFVPRAELLKELAMMEFLINIGYDPVHQAPSKLIDYYLAGRPVLSFPDNEVDKDRLDEFLAGDYRNQFVFADMDRFRIRHVCDKFLHIG